MKILSVVGARPNFIKIAALAEEMKNIPAIKHLLVHSGQHYDAQMSQAFFRDLLLPEPDINLGVGPGTHAGQTAEVMKRLEPVVTGYGPDVVVVVGDVNSTLAAAITATKLCVRVAHIEAGLRSFDWSMPEEINRKLTDAVSDFLFVTEESGVQNLINEGVPRDRIHFVGNVMIDTLLRHREAARGSGILNRLGLVNNGMAVPRYAVVTLHRPSNVDHPGTLRDVFGTLHELAHELPIFFPVHPRTHARIIACGCEGFFTSGANGPVDRGLRWLTPLGYLDFLCLMDNSSLVLTDSGGIQEETTVLGIPCLTLRENTERPVTVEHGTNRLVGLNRERILAEARRALCTGSARPTKPPLWDGQAASRVLNKLTSQLGKGKPKYD